MIDNKKLTAFMYALGYLGISILIQTTVKWYQYFYTPPTTNQGGLKILIPLGLIGISMIIARIFDGIADPLVAYFSDKSRSKMGRRIPFILFGSPPLVISFILIWFPPVQGQSLWNFIYLTIVLSLFFIFFTIVVAPYLALIGEISETEGERINLTMMQGITQVIGIMVAEVGSGILINISSFKIMGFVLGIVSLLTIILTPIFVREKPVRNEQKVNRGIFSSIIKTFSNKNFLYFLIPCQAVWFGINTLTISMPYISEVLLGMSPESSGFMIGGAFIVAVIFSPFLPKLTLKYGKKRVMAIAVIGFGVVLIGTGLLGTLLQGVAAYILILSAGIPLAVILVVLNAMVADIAEADALINGERREGMFFGASGFVNKFVLGLSSLFTPLMFNVFGNTIQNPLGLQLSGPVAGILIIISSLLLKNYSLTEERLGELRMNRGDYNGQNFNQT